MKIRNDFMLSIALVLLATTVFAASDQRVTMQRRGGGMGVLADQSGVPANLPPLIVALDLDKDGKLSSAEIANAPVNLQTLDKDKDGRLTHDEFGFGPAGRSGATGTEMPRGRGAGGPGPMSIIAALDANHDGVIDGQEIAGAGAAISALDVNADGQLSADEMFGGRGRGPAAMGPGPLHAVLDANRDAVIDAQEISGAPAAILTLDTDKDGQVAAPEMFGGRGYMRGAGGQPPEGMRGRGPGFRGEPIVRALDVNQDGVLDATEIANAAAALLSLDQNKDGRLILDELRPS